MSHLRISALEDLVARYEKTLMEFAAINEELRTLPASERLAEILALNEQSTASTARLLESARQRLESERRLVVAGTATADPMGFSTAGSLITP